MSDYRSDGFRRDSGRGDYRGSYQGGRDGYSGHGSSGQGGQQYSNRGNGGRDGYRGDSGGQRRGLPLSELDPALTEVSRKVIGCAIEVHRGLGPGFSEETYLAALCVELTAAGVAFRKEEEIPVRYKDQVVGSVCVDLHIDSRFIVEVMARPGEIGSHERSSLRAQLKATDHELGLIINFAERRLKDGLVRVLNMEKININRGEEPGEEDLDARGMVDFEEAN